MSTLIPPTAPFPAASVTFSDGSTAFKNPITDLSGNDAVPQIVSAVAASAPADNFATITPSDSAALATIPKALFIGAGGTLTVRGGDGVQATFAVVAGQIIPIRARVIMATGTTATGIVAIS